MKQDAKQAAESVSRIRQLLAEWLLKSDESREPVAEILQLLEPLDGYLRDQMSRGGATKKGEGGEGGISYSLAVKNGEEFLTEHRAGGTSPYRCPRYIFDATVVVLTKADPSYDFDQVVSGVMKSYADAPEWQVRTVLRFLSSRQPPLILRERNRYRPLTPKKLVGEAKAAWQALAKGK
jgi:hypothetical protein